MTPSEGKDSDSSDSIKTFIMCFIMFYCFYYVFMYVLTCFIDYSSFFSFSSL